MFPTEAIRALSCHNVVLPIGRMSQPLWVCPHAYPWVLLLFNSIMGPERQPWMNGLSGASCYGGHRVISETDMFFCKSLFWHNVRVFTSHNFHVLYLNNRVSNHTFGCFMSYKKTACFTRLVSVDVFRKSDMAWFWLSWKHGLGVAESSPNWCHFYFHLP